MPYPDIRSDWWQKKETDYDRYWSHLYKYNFGLKNSNDGRCFDRVLLPSGNVPPPDGDVCDHFHGNVL